VVGDKRYRPARALCVARKPQSRYRLTRHGREALLDYVAHLARLLPASNPSQENDEERSLIGRRGVPF
jgi:hypothetical protein